VQYWVGEWVVAALLEELAYTSIQAASAAVLGPHHK
jgi:hypothetical protein